MNELSRENPSMLVFDDSFSTDGMTAQECMSRVEEIAIQERRRLSQVAAERLIHRGYFNGCLQTNVKTEGKHAVVEVVLNDYGLPEWKDE